MGEPDQVPTGNVNEVMAWVGNDPARCEAALEAERAKPAPRTSLISQLEALRNGWGSDLAGQGASDSPAEVSTPSAEADAQVVSNTGEPGVVGADGHDDNALCAEHFPQGWDSPACHKLHQPAHLYPRVFCEHAPEGGFIRPVGR